MWHTQPKPTALVVRVSLIVMLLAALTSGITHAKNAAMNLDGSGAGSLRPAIAAATLIVTNLNDSGPGSLRQAIADAAPGGSITFAVSGTIILTSGELVVDKDVILSGPGAAHLGISGNQASISLASRVINNTAHLAITGLTIRDGEAGAGAGGGILNAGSGVLTIANSVITGNRAQKGGGVFNSPGGTLQVVNSTVSYNQTRLVDVGLDANGAGVYNAAPGGVATIEGSTFYLNAAHDHGSGLYNESTAAIANSTFSLNQAATGALHNSGAMQLNNVTISLNIGKRQTNGLLSTAGSVTVANSIIAGNGSISNPLPDCDGTITSGGHNLIGNATGCTVSAGADDLLGSKSLSIDPKLGPLRDNGGPTWTQLLLAGSPAIDAGNPAAPGSGGSACDVADQRGVVRPVLGTTSLTCDIGAVELGSAGPLTNNSSPTVLGQATTFAVSGLADGFQFLWDFGDGATSTTNPSSHTYSTAGFFTAVVTATNGASMVTATTPVVVFRQGLYLPLIRSAN